MLQRQRPSGNRMSAAIDDRNLFQVRQVYIDIGSGRFQLERLRMGTQFVFFLNALVGCRIDCPDGPCLFITIPYVNTLIRSVVSQVIDITVEVNLRDEIEGGSVVYVKLSFAAPDKQLVLFRSVDHALRIRHPGYRVLQGSPADVDHLDRIVAQCGDKQLSSTRTKMIETSLDALQRNRFGQNERAWALRNCIFLSGHTCHACESQRYKEVNTATFFHRVLRVNISESPTFA